MRTYVPVPYIQEMDIVVLHAMKEHASLVSGHSLLQHVLLNM